MIPNNSQNDELLSFTEFLNQKGVQQNPQSESNLDRYASPETKDLGSDAIFEKLVDAFWDKIGFWSTHPGLNVTVSSNESPSYLKVIRESDTANGKNFRIDKPSKLRCFFFLLQNQSVSDCYILSPAALSAQNTPTLVSDLTSYAGIHIKNGKIWAVVKNSSGKKASIESNITIVDNTTYTLDVEYTVSNVSIYINQTLIATMGCSLTLPDLNNTTYYSIIVDSSIPTDTAVRLSVEYAQFIQNRN